MGQEKILQFIATTGSRLSDLPISDGQLIFLQDRHKIVLDFNGSRKFYNDIEILGKDSDRTNLMPENGRFYFVIGTAVLWFYQDKWVQLTSAPEGYVFIGVELPEAGSENQLYVNKNKRNISVWDNGSYITVGEVTDSISNEEIDALFQ